MSRSLRALALGTLIAAAPLTAQQQKISVSHPSDTILVVRLGPVNLPAHAMHHDVHQLALQTWRMPAGGWLRGYKVEMVDARGNVLPRVMLHHAEVVDLDRRDLLRHAYNRVVSQGKETSDLLLPAGMGYPVAANQQMGINAMLHNPTGDAYPAAYVRATFRIIPAGTPNVRNIMSFYAETSYDSTGDSDFDLPPGELTKEVDFTVPIAGQVLAVGGHIHDYGQRFVVARADAPDTLYNAVPRTDSTGAVLGMPTQPMFGRAFHIAAGDRFVMKVTYDNTSGELLEKAGMGTFGVVFAPDDVAQWPALNRDDPEVRRDLAQLQSGMTHMMNQGMQMHRH